MARTIANGDIANRDRLFYYTIGEFFQELSMFIQEVEEKNKAIEKALKKK
jgi:hypothetical protein